MLDIHITNVLFFTIQPITALILIPAITQPYQLIWCQHIRDYCHYMFLSTWQVPAVAISPWKAAQRAKLIHTMKSFLCMTPSLLKITAVVSRLLRFCQSWTVVHKLFITMFYISLSCIVHVRAVFLINFWQQWKSVSGRAAVEENAEASDHGNSTLVISFPWATIKECTEQHGYYPQIKTEFFFLVVEQSML